MSKLIPLALTLAITPTVACLPGAPIANAVSDVMWGDVQTMTGYGGSSAVQVVGSGLRGDIGAIEGIDGRNGRVNSYAEEGMPYLSVDVTIVNEDGSAGMAILYLQGLFADLSSTPTGVYRANAFGSDVVMDDNGDSYTVIDGDEPEIATGEEDRVDVTVCSGNEVDNWEYDAPAESVVVEVEEPIEYEAGEECPECEPIATRRVTFWTDTPYDDGSGNEVHRQASGALTFLVDPSVAQ